MGGELCQPCRRKVRGSGGMADPRDVPTSLGAVAEDIRKALERLKGER